MLPLLADIGFQKLELVANAKVPVLRGELVVGDQLQNTHSSSYDQHHHYHQLRAEFDISLHKDDYVFHNSLLLRDWLRGGDGQNLHHHGHPQTACLRIWTREFPTPGGAATSRAGETSTKSGENMRRRTSAAPQFPFPGSAQQALELDRTFLPYRFSLVLKQWGGSSNIFSNQRAPFLQFRPTQHRPLYLNNYCLLLMMFYYLNRRAEYFWTTFHAAGFPGPNWDLPAVFLDFGRFWLYEFQPEREVVDIFTGTPADVNRAAAPTHLHLVIKDPVLRPGAGKND
eukprot:g12084.t1